jgi:hypothetical protein
MFGTGVADYALEPRYAELLWEVSAEMVYSRGITTGQEMAEIAAGKAEAPEH